jgi:cobalt/nickel transport system permease protein
MHIPDGFLDAKTWLSTTLASSGAISYSLKKLKADLDDKRLPFMGVLAAFIFAAQMINFPIPGGTSGHLLGGALAAILLGPWAASLVMTIILVVQALLFADGGITTLGANIFNMAILAPFIGAYFYSLIIKLSNNKLTSLAAFIAAWITVVIAAISTALELSISGTSPLKLALPAMVGWHTIIGAGEGLITASVVNYLARIRPDLLNLSKEAREKGRGLIVIGGLALALAVFLSPFASALPDGLERVAKDLGFLERGTNLVKGPLSDYTWPSIANEKLATALAGFLGVIITFLIAYAIVIVLKRRQMSNGT